MSDISPGITGGIFNWSPWKGWKQFNAHPFHTTFLLKCQVLMALVLLLYILKLSLLSSHVTGLLCIHLVTAGVGMLEKLKDTFTAGKRRPSEAFSSPDQVIALHRFGSSTAGSGAAPGSPGAGEVTAASTILSDSYKRRVASLNRKWNLDFDFSLSSCLLVLFSWCEHYNMPWKDWRIPCFCTWFC